MSIKFWNLNLFFEFKLETFKKSTEHSQMFQLELKFLKNIPSGTNFNKILGFKFIIRNLFVLLRDLRQSIKNSPTLKLWLCYVLNLTSH